MATEKNPSSLASKYFSHSNYSPIDIGEQNQWSAEGIMEKCAIGTERSLFMFPGKFGGIHIQSDNYTDESVLRLLISFRLMMGKESPKAPRINYA